MNGNSSKSLVSVQIFSLVHLNVIYLHCQVQICVQIGSDTCAIVSTSYQNKINLMQLRYIMNVSKVTNVPFVVLFFYAGLSTKNCSLFKHIWKRCRYLWTSTQISGK